MMAGFMNGVPTICVFADHRIAKTCEVMQDTTEFAYKEYLSILPLECGDVGFCLGENPNMLSLCNDNDNDSDNESFKVSFSYVDIETSKLIFSLIENLRSTYPNLIMFRILVIDSQQGLAPAKQTRNGVPRAYQTVINIKSDIFYNLVKNYSNRCVV